MNSGADAESLLQSPTPGSPAARLPPLKRNSGGKAEARRSLIEVVTMGKTNKISPETAQPSPSGNTESASAPDTETLPLRGSEEAGTTGAKPGRSVTCCILSLGKRHDNIPCFIFHCDLLGIAQCISIKVGR